MDKNEFKKKAAVCGYSEKEIAEFIQLTKEARKDGVPMDYGDIVLVEQPKY